MYTIVRTRDQYTKVKKISIATSQNTGSPSAQTLLRCSASSA